MASATQQPTFTSNHPEAALLLCRFQQFKDAVSRISGQDLVTWLHECHYRVDTVLETCRDLELHKFQNSLGFETFIITSGTVSSTPGDVNALIKLSQKIEEAVAEVTVPGSGECTKLNFVVTAGEASTAIVGFKSLAYGVTGESVWTALMSSNLGSYSMVLTEPAFKRVETKKNWELLQTLELPGQGRLGVYVEVASVPLPAVEESSVATTSAPARPPSLARTHASHPWLLSFASEQLENKFASHLSRGMVSMDSAFYLVAAVTQTMWVFKWQWSTSLMGLWMCLLVLINSLLLLATWAAPNAYVTHRAPLCVASHVLHKIVQVIVSTSPGTGTIFQPGYNAVVALIETSGFAQVWMLTFGMRVRLWQHLILNLFDVLMAVVLEDHLICGVVFRGVPSLTCNAAMWLYTVVGQYVLPCMLIFALERSSRRKFVEQSLK